MVPTAGDADAPTERVAPESPVQPDATGRRSPDRRFTRNVLLTVALAVATVLGIAIMYAGNAATWTAPESPPVLGLGLQRQGVLLDDVYVNTHRGNRLPTRTAHADVVASISVQGGVSDRLLSVAVDGERATLTGADGASPSMGLAISPARTLTTGFGREPAHVRVPLAPHQVEGRPLVPVTFMFAERGPMTLMAPVWPALSGPPWK